MRHRERLMEHLQHLPPHQRENSIVNMTYPPSKLSLDYKNYLLNQKWHSHNNVHLSTIFTPSIKKNKRNHCSTAKVCPYKNIQCCTVLAWRWHLNGTDSCLKKKILLSKIKQWKLLKISMNKISIPFTAPVNELQCQPATIWLQWKQSMTLIS